MGAKISFEHDPAQYQALKDAELAVLKHYEADAVVKETWLDLSSSDHDSTGVSKIRCLQVGRKGRPVLCIHGGGGMPTDWASLFPHLQHDDLQFWFIERPGHGLSDPFDYSAVTIDNHAAALIDAVRKVAHVEKIDIVANSMGGWYAYSYAKLKPEHVRSLTWIGAPARYRGQPMPLDFRIMASWLGTQIMSLPPPDKVPRKLIFESFNQNKDAVPDCFVHLYKSIMSLRNNSLSWNSLLRTAIAPQYEFDLERLELLSAQFPCHLIIGSQDPFLAPDKRAIIEEQFGEPAIVAGQGHLPWLEDPNGVAEAIVKFVA